MFLYKRAEKIYGNTPLHTAVKRGCIEDVKSLLEAGAYVDSKNDSGSAPLHLAAERGNQEIIETILTCGADINSTDRYGRTALHIASEQMHNEVVVTLLNYGCEINIVDINNHTPIELAKNLLITLLCRHQIDRRKKCKRELERLSKIFEVLMLHTIKMKSANFYVSDNNFKAITHGCNILEVDHLFVLCVDELKLLKTEKINNTGISFYDILIKDEGIIDVRNGNIVQALTSANYKTKFPVYANMIDRRFQKGMERKELLEQGIDNFHLLCNCLPKLPFECLENILKYLSNQELRVLGHLVSLNFNFPGKIKPIQEQSRKSRERRSFREKFKGLFKFKE